MSFFILSVCFFVSSSLGVSPLEGLIPIPLLRSSDQNVSTASLLVEARRHLFSFHQRFRLLRPPPISVSTLAAAKRPTVDDSLSMSSLLVRDHALTSPLLFVAAETRSIIFGIERKSQNGKVSCALNLNLVDARIYFCVGNKRRCLSKRQQEGCEKNNLASVLHPIPRSEEEAMKQNPSLSTVNEFRDCTLIDDIEEAFEDTLDQPLSMSLDEPYIDSELREEDLRSNFSILRPDTDQSPFKERATNSISSLWERPYSQSSSDTEKTFNSISSLWGRPYSQSSSDTERTFQFSSWYLGNMQLRINIAYTVSWFHDQLVPHSWICSVPRQKILSFNVPRTSLGLKVDDLFVSFKEREFRYFSSLWERSIPPPSSIMERTFPSPPYSSFTEEIFEIKSQIVPQSVGIIRAGFKSRSLSNSTKIESTFQSDSITSVILHRLDEKHVDFYEILQVCQDLKLCFLSIFNFRFNHCTSYVICFNRRVFVLISIVCSFKV